MYGREWWFDTVNYGVNFGGLDSMERVPPWDAADGSGTVATVLQHIEQFAVPPNPPTTPMICGIMAV